MRFFALLGGGIVKYRFFLETYEQMNVNISRFPPGGVSYENKENC
jgi:hypothetical protein